MSSGLPLVSASRCSTCAYSAVVSTRAPPREIAIAAHSPCPVPAPRVTSASGEVTAANWASIPGAAWNPPSAKTTAPASIRSRRPPDVATACRTLPEPCSASSVARRPCRRSPPRPSKRARRRRTATSHPYPRQTSPRRFGRTGANTGTPHRFAKRTVCPRSQSYARPQLRAHICAKGALYTPHVSLATRAMICSGAAVGGRPAAWNFPPLIRLLLQPARSADFSSRRTRAPSSRARRAAVTPARPAPTTTTSVTRSSTPPAVTSLGKERVGHNVHQLPRYRGRQAGRRAERSRDDIRPQAGAGAGAGHHGRERGQADGGGNDRTVTAKQPDQRVLRRGALEPDGGHRNTSPRCRWSVQ